MMWWRLPPRSFTPAPVWPKNLVAISTLLRRAPSASASTSSDWPWEYMSAVSNRFTPTSRHMSICRLASEPLVSPMPANMPAPPKVIAPKL